MQNRRKLYVNTLIAIFEWGARQIKTTKKMEKIKRGESSAQLFNLGDCLSSSDDEQPSDDNEVRSDGYESGSGMRRRHGSGTSVCSVSSVCSRTEPALLRKNSIIRRETQIQFDEDEDDGEVLVNSRGWAVMRDSIDFVKAGIESIIEDEVTSRFEAEQLASWNMLTRTSIRFYQFVNWKLTVLYSLGFLLRYCVLLPLRISIFSIGLVFLVVSTAIIGLFPDGALKRRLNFNCMLICYRILSRSVSAVVHFHDEHNRPPGSGIAVANHTSPMDAMILSTDNVYALIGQRHPGILGLVQRALSRASSHIWFERSEAKDRATVAHMLREHTSWAIICNVWYLPPMRIHEGEDAIDFANRVKKAIAQKGGLVDLEWDGQLKRSRVPPKLVRKQQEKYCHRFARYTSTSDGLRANAEAEDDGEYITFKSPGVSGYNSLEELPEDVIVSSDEDEGTIPEDAIPTRQRRRHARERQ
ncbi:unnamed protein product, partial [Mesorhabditis belari]|uniref:Phospholipid/glycerol acyltransferase domain-containing protein n=1 Tax=Mesorhabditis belari TaxID=2138241 RepID=A0AAF3FPI8_9BILA